VDRKNRSRLRLRSRITGTKIIFNRDEGDARDMANTKTNSDALRGKCKKPALGRVRNAGSGSTRDEVKLTGEMKVSPAQ